MIDTLFKVSAVVAGSTIVCGFTAILGLCVGYMDIAAAAGQVAGIMAVVAGLSYLGGCIAFRKKYGK